jgi:uncharacterized protein (TIGR03067 family)
MILTAFLAYCIMHIAGCSGAAGKDAKAMQGEWREVKKGLRYVINGDEITFDPEGANRRLKFKLDPSQSPKAIDMIMLNGPNEGKTAEGIYELEDGELKICAPNSGNALSGGRPREFKTEPKEGVVLVILERAGK